MGTEKLCISPFLEDMDDDECETLTSLVETVLDSIDIPTLSVLMADEIFGEQLDSENEYLLLSKILADDSPLRSEFLSKIYSIFESYNLNDPDVILFQVLGRKAGFRHPRDLDYGKYCCLFSLTEHQIFVTDQGEEVLLPGFLSKVYEMRDQKPFIPSNKTLIKLANGKATVKSNKYKCFMIWAFWRESPSKGSKQNNETSSESQKITNESIEISQNELTIANGENVKFFDYNQKD